MRPMFRLVTSAYVDAPTAEAIGLRARKLRESAGTLSGHALGEAFDTAEAGAAYDLLRDILAVVPAEEPKVWSEIVVARLAELRPNVYGGWDPEGLATALKPHGVPTGQVWGKTESGKGANRRGIERSRITAVIAERDGNRDAG